MNKIMALINYLKLVFTLNAKYFCSREKKKEENCCEFESRRMTLDRYYVKVVFTIRYLKYFIKHYSAVKGTDATFVG